jgi:hypothetical protein
MRSTYLILGLVALITVVGLFMGGSPEHAERMAQASRDAAFGPESRQIVLVLLALGLGGFIAYLTLTRR